MTIRTQAASMGSVFSFRGPDYALSTSTGLRKDLLGTSMAIIMAIAGTTTGVAAEPAPVVQHALPKGYSPIFLSAVELNHLVSTEISLELNASEILPSHAESVRWLHEASGLTWEQMGRIFGVSRRAVHFWASGGKLNASNVEALRKFATIVRNLHADTPSSRRDTLLSFDTDGQSIVEKFRAENASHQTDIQKLPLSPWSLMGANHDRTV